ncbi:hypothetical protein J7T55_003833 [Diaporthe amygdali]|uniref:uncharacterized protein n=1 Tax=Phomopsis amygdali TaxID=1214568 RepID=UPI0022FEF24E|nr:uncharacterized protein J7T55_003833 [Diaporthe amygdali]KAJ0117419.1 hypothetical protein J7T55_003833 [Diaporthe amygdali]
MIRKAHRLEDTAKDLEAGSGINAPTVDAYTTTTKWTAKNSRTSNPRHRHEAVFKTSLEGGKVDPRQRGFYSRLREYLESSWRLPGSLFVTTKASL